MRHRRVGDVLATLCVVAGALGVLAIALLAPPARGASTSGTRWVSLHVVASALPGGNENSLTAGATGSAPPSPSGSRWISLHVAASAVQGEMRHGPGSSVAPTAPPVVTPAPVLVSPAPPAETFVSNAVSFPLPGEATVFGCAAALEYLDAYAAPGFAFQCPGNALGHQAMTACVSGDSPCSVMRLIVIADPCPAAYMNEASNSWTLIGVSDAPIDPYGSCA